MSAPGDRASRAFQIFILSLISLNVLALILESVEEIRAVAGTWFRVFEIVSVIIFTVEYAFRLWACTASPAYSQRLRGRLRFARTPFAVMDLLAILPFYLPFTGLDMRFIRAVRLFRVFRIMKVARYSSALQTLGRVCKRTKEQLVTTLCVLCVLLVLAASLMYHAEHAAQPEAFSSIPAAMWWGVATLTTVGYGDVYPVTTIGKILASVIAILGIGMFALPTGILGAAFVEEIQRQRGPKKCPHCGKQLNEP